MIDVPEGALGSTSFPVLGIHLDIGWVLAEWDPVCNVRPGNGFSIGEEPGRL